VHLERLPLTANRKVDRQALAALGLAARPTPEPREAPSDGLEAIICAVACEVVGIADLGANQNIFEAGANSVHVMELTSRLRARLGRELEVASFFEHPTARTLAASLLAQGPGAPGGEASACADRRRLTKRARLVRNRDDRGPTGGDEGAGQP
jgi:aryl carrier-like protein